MGDGIVQMWVDGTLVIDYNGGDPASAAYRQTWTRTNDFGSPLQFPSVLNGGAPQAQSQWWDNAGLHQRICKPTAFFDTNCDCSYRACQHAILYGLAGNFHSVGKRHTIF